MTTLFHILSGARLEMFLVLLGFLSLWYSTDARDLLRLVPALRPVMDRMEVDHLTELKAVHNNAYNLILTIAGRITRNLIRWSLVSVGILVLYNLGDYFQFSIMESERITRFAFAAVFAAPLFGLVLSVLWVRRLTVELRDFEKTLLGFSQRPRQAS